MAQATSANLAAVAKAIGDLEALVRGLIQGLPASKPWQRQALDHLGEADRAMQVLRLSIALEREQEELVDAARQVQLALRAARAFTIPARADLITKTGLKLASDLSDKLHVSLARATSAQ